MRSFEERRAEVVLRAELKKKKERRMRRAALSLCIPIVLCALVLGAFIHNNIKVTTDGADQDLPLADSAGVETSASISYGGEVYTTDDFEKVLAIYDIVYPANDDECKDTAAPGGASQPSKNENHSQKPQTLEIEIYGTKHKTELSSLTDEQLRQIMEILEVSL